MSTITSNKLVGSGTVRSILILLVAFLLLSLTDVVIKLLSGGYPMLEIVIIRTVFALPIVLWIFRRSGRWVELKKIEYTKEFIRGMAMFTAYIFFFMALAALPYSLMLGIFFSGPLFITALSAPMLGEGVGWRRWLAVLVGFVGVLIVIEPWGANFQPASLLAVAAAACYALSMIYTRKINDSPQIITVSTTLVYLGAALIMSPIFANLPVEAVHPSIQFLTRSWTTPTLLDLFLIAMIAVGWGAGMVLLSSSYRNTPVAVLAPFEYFSIVYGILLGYLFWGEIPTLTMLIGTTLIVGSGLFIIYRENRAKGT